MANEGSLPLLKHGSLRLTRDLLRAEDADDEPSDLLFSVEYEGGVSGGYIERVPAVSDTPRLPDPRHAICKRGFSTLRDCDAHDVFRETLSVCED